MGVFNKLSENIKKGVRNWLDITPSSPYAIRIHEVMDFELTAIRNRIWYRGDGNEIEQMYQQNAEYADRHKFWASRCTPGMELRKIHTGLPGLIVRMLSSIVLTDLNDFEFDQGRHELLWREIEKDNKFRRTLERSLKETLYIGDGAWKISIDTKLSMYPIIEWFPGDRVEFVWERGRLKEIIFKTPYRGKAKEYVLCEHYGYGYIRNELYCAGQEVLLTSLEETKDLKDYAFDPQLKLGIPMRIYENTKFEGRGGSIFDGKQDSYDAYDEVWSQWMDALRKGRAIKYIPEDLIPRDPEKGDLLKPNPFDNSFIKVKGSFSENGGSQIDVEQPTIPHDSYLASYVTALDQCLQGVISPSTLGIDVKKLDNAEAQREKEKATLYTRDAIIEALQETLPELIAAAINAQNLLNKEAVEDIKVNIPIGEYANPSFESQVETLTKARPGSVIMSVEAQVEELYGDSKDKDWKAEETARIKAELGIAEVEEPGVNMSVGGFTANIQEGDPDAGDSGEEVVSNEPTGVPGAAAGSE